MRTATTVGLGVLVGAAVVAVPLAYKVRTTTDYRNLRVVEAGRLYRSGQMTPAGFDRVVRELGIRTVISLRDSRDDDRPPPDAHEAEFCAANGIGFHRLSPAAWSAPDGSVPADKNIQEYLRILSDPATPRPVLVHCFAGMHRTGAHVAVYRMEFQRWPAADAVAEMVELGSPRKPFAADLLAYVGSYRPVGGRGCDR